MLRMLRMSGLKTADVLALTTGFVVTLDDPAMDSMTVMRSVESRATDLNRIHAVNQLSRDFCEGNIDLDALFHRVRDIYRSTKCWHLHLQVLYQESVFTEEKKPGCSRFL